MPLTNELRVFISSTFRDLQEEREHLVKRIFPEVSALCRERGITFTEVDLRWGLTEENLVLGQVIRACLEEVDKCRPYFIGITGDRYGYVPTYLDIQKDPTLLAQYPWTMMFPGINSLLRRCARKSTYRITITFVTLTSSPIATRMKYAVDA